MQFTDIDGNGTVNLSEFCDLVNIMYATIGSISPRVSKQPDSNYGNIIVDTVTKTA